MRTILVLVIEHDDIDLSQFVYYFPDDDEYPHEIVSESWIEVPPEETP